MVSRPGPSLTTAGQLAGRLPICPVLRRVPLVTGFFLLRRLAFAIPLMASLATTTIAWTATPSPEVVRPHIDESIRVEGNFAAVKLPIRNGPPFWNPTAVRFAADGTLFVANFNGQIFTVHDTDGDGLEDTTRLFADVRKDGLRAPTSLAIRGGEVFVGTTQEIRVYQDADGDGAADRSRTFFKGFPWSEHAFDWTLGLTFDRQGRLYFALHTDSYNPAPAPDPEKLRGTLLRLEADGTGLTRIATGLRAPYGMAFDAQGELFFSDNRGGANASEEINRVVEGGFYGHYPAKFRQQGPGLGPIVGIRHGHGIAGITFNSPSNDFGGTAGDLFVALWGADFRWELGSISRVRFQRDAQGILHAEESLFAKQVPKIVDLAFGPQGDLYVAQFGRENPGHYPYKEPSGGLFRFIHAPWHPAPRGPAPHPIISGDPEKGRQLFNSLGCAGCHGIGDNVPRLGPDLGDIGDLFEEQDVLQAITLPNDGIKTGHEGTEFTLSDGETVTGRILESDDRQITLLQAGEQVVKLDRSRIVTNRLMQTSLMPSGLLNGLSREDVDNLLCYLKVRRPPAMERWQQAAIDRFRYWRFQPRATKVTQLGIATAALVLAGWASSWLVRTAFRRRLSAPR